MIPGSASFVLPLPFSALIVIGLLLDHYYYYICVALPSELDGVWRGGGLPLLLLMLLMRYLCVETLFSDPCMQCCSLTHVCVMRY